MKPEEYFSSSHPVNKKRYDALHDFFVDGLSAAEVAAKYEYTLNSFYSLTRDFRKHLDEGNKEEFFFKDTVLGRKPVKEDELKELIISLRKKGYSAEDIVGIANSKSYEVSYEYVRDLLHDEGFARLPRRSVMDKRKLELPPVEAPVAEKLVWKAEKFHSAHTGLFAFLPVIFKYGIHSLMVIEPVEILSVQTTLRPK